MSLSKPIPDGASPPGDARQRPQPDRFFGPFRVILDQALPGTRVESPFGPFYSRVYGRWTEHTTVDSDYYREQLSRIGDSRFFIDLGCGTGRVSRRLAAHGHHGICVDTSPEMLAALQERAQADNGAMRRLRLVQADLTQLVIDRPCDAAILGGLTFSLFGSADQRHRVLRAANSFLKPGGLLMFDYLPGVDTGSPPGDVHFAFGGSGSSVRGFCWAGIHRDVPAGIQLANFLSELVDETARTERVLASTTSYLLEPRDVAASLHNAGFDMVDEHVPAPGMGPIVTAIKR